MREIKFRGWHVQNKRMFSAEEMAVDQLTLLPTGSFINVHGVHTHLSTIYDREKFIPMQFTGLKDKNGKEIYEGDIIQNVADDGRRLSNFEITWQQSCCGFVKEREDGNTFTLEISRFFEVIGNIYETPELVTPK